MLYRLWSLMNVKSEPLLGQSLLSVTKGLFAGPFLGDDWPLHQFRLCHAIVVLDDFTSFVFEWVLADPVESDGYRHCSNDHWNAFSLLDHHFCLGKGPIVVRNSILVSPRS